MTRIPIIRDSHGTVIVSISLSQQAHNHREHWEYANGNPAVRVLETNRTRMKPMMRVPHDYVNIHPEPVFIGVSDEYGSFTMETKK